MIGHLGQNQKYQMNKQMSTKTEFGTEMQVKN
jgi:hypothetical protein